MTGPNTLRAGKYSDFVERDGWEYITRKQKGIVVIFPIIETCGKYNLVLIDEYRKPLDRRVISLPAGLVDVGEGAFDAARRELEEETGYRANSLELVGSDFPLSPGLTDECFNLFIARSLEKVSSGGGDENEDIKVVTIETDGFNDKLNEMRSKGLLIDPKIYMGAYFWWRG